MTVQITTLKSGLRVITDDIPGIATATLGLWVQVGARYEPASINGISHFLEHMAFKGTTTRSAKQIAEEIENVGGHLNAYTSREATAYHARVLAEDVPLAVELIADIIQNSTFEEEEIARERDVILQEIGQSFDTPDDIIFDYFQETAFPDQPLGRPILGPPEIIRKITRNDLNEYMKREYSASRMIFAAAGGVNHDKIVELCEKNFTRLSSPATENFKKAFYQGGHFFEKRKLEQVHLVLGFESCPANHPDHYALAVFSSLLGGGMSSRLFQEVREKRGLVYSIYSFKSAFQDSGIFAIYAGTGEQQVDELLPTLKNILKDFPNTLEDKEIERSKAQLKAGTLMSLESTSARCERLAQHLMTYNRSIPPQEVIKKVNAVTRKDIIRVASQLISTPPTFAALGPGKEIGWA
ncbi:MAG: insulinase family protein [Alphaproteobacteria bacterium]|nr:insulinase family protein [Alphaproteobacteria bacterium]